MLSIVIPTLNEENDLPRLLSCLASQDYKDIEIIVSDGNSEDKTVEIANKYDCKVIISKKRSPSHQRNEGAKIAKGSLILFLDADTLLPSSFLSSVIFEFNQRNLDVAGFYFMLNSNKFIYKAASIYGYVMCSVLSRAIHPISVGAAILVKRDFHERIKGFDESVFVGEDHLYSRNIQKSGGRYGLIKSKKILYSVRRFEKEGPWRLGVKWHYLSLHYLFHGGIKKKIADYEFGKY